MVVVPLFSMKSASSTSATPQSVPCSRRFWFAFDGLHGLDAAWCESQYIILRQSPQSVQTTYSARTSARLCCLVRFSAHQNCPRTQSAWSLLGQSHPSSLLKIQTWPLDETIPRWFLYVIIIPSKTHYLYIQKNFLIATKYLKVLTQNISVWPPSSRSLLCHQLSKSTRTSCPATSPLRLSRPGKSERWGETGGAMIHDVSSLRFSVF